MKIAGTCVALLVLGAAGAAAGQAQFIPLGDLPAGPFFSEGLAVSADGSTAVGQSLVGGAPPFSAVYGAFSWRAGVLSAIYPSASAESSRAAAVTANGITAVGSVDFGFFSDFGTQVTVFENGSWHMLGDLPGGVSKVPRSVGRGVSADGQVVVGIGESDLGVEAFWLHRPSGVMAPLGDLPGGGFASYAYGVSGDGALIVGQGEAATGQQACYWTQATGIHPLDFLSTGAGVTRASAAYAVSEDGSTMVGYSRSEQSGNGGEACVWVGGGTPRGLGDLPTGAMQSAALAVSGDGKRVVGRGYVDGPCGPFGCGSKPRAFVWSQDTGMLDIQQVLETTYGLSLPGWDLREATGISRDGRVIVGSGLSPGGSSEGWMAVIPWISCYADCNGDGGLNLADFGCFQTKFALGDPYADCNGDQQLNLADFGCFTTKFALGCP